MMDIDFMKPSSSNAADQMQMMLMQMEKLPDFSGTFSSIHQIPMMDFTNDNINNNNHTNNINNLQPPTTISFSGDPSSEAASFMTPPAEGWGDDDLYSGGGGGDKRSSMAAMREMIFRIAAMQPINIDPEAVKPPKRRNVKISTDPQSVAARHRRERISERIRILQRLVPGGTKMDTASMLDEAIHYVKFLKNQVQSLERVAAGRPPPEAGIGFPVPMSSGSYFPVVGKGYHDHDHHRRRHLADA